MLKIYHFIDFTTISLRIHYLTACVVTTSNDFIEFTYKGGKRGRKPGLVLGVESTGMKSMKSIMIYHINIYIIRTYVQLTTSLRFHRFHLPTASTVSLVSFVKSVSSITFFSFIVAALKSYRSPSVPFGADGRVKPRHRRLRRCHRQGIVSSGIQRCVCHNIHERK